MDSILFMLTRAVSDINTFPKFLEVIYRTISLGKIILSSLPPLMELLKTVLKMDLEEI